MCPKGPTVTVGRVYRNQLGKYSSILISPTVDDRTACMPYENTCCAIDNHHFS